MADLTVSAPPYSQPRVLADSTPPSSGGVRLSHGMAACVAPR